MTEVSQCQHRPEFDYDDFADGGLFGDVVAEERDTALQAFLTGEGYKPAKNAKEGLPTASSNVGYVLVGADGNVITEPGSTKPKIFKDLTDMPKGSSVHAILVDNGENNKFFRLNDGSKTFQKAVVRGDQTEILTAFKDKYKTNDSDGFENIQVDPATGKMTFKKIDEATFPKGKIDKESVTFLDNSTILVNADGKNYIVNKTVNPGLYKTLSEENKASLDRQRADQKDRLEQALSVDTGDDIDPEEIAEQLDAELAGPIKNKYKTDENENPTGFSKDIKFLATNEDGELLVDETTGKPQLFDRKDLPEGSAVIGVAWTDADGDKHLKVHDGENTDDFVQTVLIGDKNANLNGAKPLPDAFDKATIKTVAFVDGNTLAVTDASGNKYEVSRFVGNGTLFNELIGDTKYKDLYEDGLETQLEQLGELLGGELSFKGIEYSFKPATT